MNPRPCLYVCVSIRGRVSLRQVYDGRDGDIAVTWALPGEERALRVAVEDCLGRDDVGRLNGVPLYDPYCTDDEHTDSLIRFRDKLHILLKWPKGPPRN